MRNAIDIAAQEGDSLGGKFEVVFGNLPIGLGSYVHWDRMLDGRIAQALMENPKVLILDEPFNGLDQKSVDYFRNELIKLKNEGVTIILTSHYKEDIEKLCDKVYEMNEGITA